MDRVTAMLNDGMGATKAVTERLKDPVKKWGKGNPDLQLKAELRRFASLLCCSFAGKVVEAHCPE